MTDIQYISDAKGNQIGVIVPIEIWREIESEKETAYLTKSETMKKRLLEAKGRTEGIGFEEVREKLGIWHFGIWRFGMVDKTRPRQSLTHRQPD